MFLYMCIDFYHFNITFEIFFTSLRSAFYISFFVENKPKLNQPLIATMEEVKALENPGTSIEDKNSCSYVQFLF